MIDVARAGGTYVLVAKPDGFPPFFFSGGAKATGVAFDDSLTSSAKGVKMHFVCISSFFMRHAADYSAQLCRNFRNCRIFGY